MKNKIILLLVGLFIYAQLGLCQSKGDQIFDASEMHQVRFYSEAEPDLYQLLNMEALGADRPYHLVEMTFDGEVLDSVGIKAKGFSSALIWEGTKPFKIDINEYVSGQRFDGLKKFNLNNQAFDEDVFQNNNVSYELFRRAGIAAPRTAYAEVYINDVFIDVYLLVEQIDDIFIKNNFSDEGELLKVQYPGLGPDLFMGVEADGAERVARTDFRNYAKFWLINLILDAQDNYPFHNYYIYYSEKEDLFHFLPWDYNLILYGLYPNINPAPLDPIEGWGSDQIIWDDPDLKSIYLDVACELYNYVLDEAHLQDFIDANFAVLQSNTNGVTFYSGDYLYSDLMERKQWLFNQIIAAGGSCGEFSCPLEIGNLVINELVAKSDSIGGVQEPDGGTPDWIELYNNTDHDIILDHHYYLSDDIDFPKKWNFDTPVTIPANGYQIVWADRDVHQQGVHTNFKIEKSGGDLMLVYEDLTILDQINYDEQELNKAYARVPNGTGTFTIQDFTFNTNNDFVSSLSSLESEPLIQLYPNPATHEINIITSESFSKIELFNASGQLLKGLNMHDEVIDLDGIPSGIYFLHFQTDHTRKIKRIIKK